MADQLERLLNYIVQHHTTPEEMKDLEHEAASGAEDEILDGRQRVTQVELSRARELGPVFSAGLRRARQARDAEGSAISLDDRDAEENQIADALVRYLVGIGVASSTSRETERHQYIYTIAMDWPALHKLAREADIDLDAALQEG